MPSGPRHICPRSPPCAAATHQCTGSPRKSPCSPRALRRRAASAAQRRPDRARAAARRSAVAYLRRALAEPLADNLRADVLAELGAAETLLDAESAVAHLRAALAATTDPDRHTRLTLVLGPALFLTQRNAEAVAAYELALAGDASPSDPALRQQLEAGLLAAAVDEGTLYPAVQRHAERLRSVAPERFHPNLAAVLAWHEARTGRTRGRCIALTERALAAERGHDTAPSFAYAGLALAVADRYDAARAVCNRTLERSQLTGSVFDFAIASWLRGIVAYVEGDLDGAVADQRQAIDAAEEHGLTAGLIHGYARLADALLDRVDLAGAETALAHVRHLSRCRRSPISTGGYTPVADYGSPKAGPGWRCTTSPKPAAATGHSAG